MEISLRHLAPYLDHKLLIVDNNFPEGRVMGSTNNNNYEIRIEAVHRLQYKPALVPLNKFKEKYEGISFSDMITHGYHHSFWLKENFNIKYLMYKDFELLVSKHADVFGLIDKGLAIDKTEK